MRRLSRTISTRCRPSSFDEEETVEDDFDEETVEKDLDEEETVEFRRGGKVAEDSALGAPIDTDQLSDYEMMIASHLDNPSDVNVSWDNIAGLESFIQELKESVVLPIQRKDLFEDSQLTQAPKGRPANSPREKPRRVINVWNEVDNTDHVKENFSPNYNSDINGGHNIVIVDSPPEVYEKIETVEVEPNDNTDYVLVHHWAPTIVREKIVTARPVTEERTRKSPVEQFADKFGHAFGLVVEDNIHNVGREAESVFDVGRSVGGAIGTILDSKAKLLVSVPRVKEAFFGALG